MIANAAGPVMTVYLEAMDVKKEEFVGNMAWFFAGAVGGYFILKKVPQKVFDISVMALAAASAIQLVAF